MKTIKKTFVLAMLLVAFVKIQAVNYKLIIYTKDDIQKISLKDAASGKVSNIPTNNKTGSGYLLECSNMNNTQILAKKASSFRVFSLDRKQSTTWIKLTDGQSISFEDCFKMYLAATTSNDANTFFVSNYQANPLYNNAVALRGGTGGLEFSAQNKTSFFNKENISLAWTLTEGELKKLSVIDITDSVQFPVWLSDNFKNNTLKYADMQTLGSKLFVQNRRYRVQATVYHTLSSATDTASFDFALLPFVYNNHNPAFFIAPDSVSLTWQTNAPINKIEITETTTQKTIMQTATVSSKVIDAAFLKQNKVKIQPAQRYTMTAYTDNNQSYKIDFECIMTNDECQKLQEFINK